MRQGSFLLLLLLGMTGGVSAQLFTLVNAGLQPLQNSSVSWGDWDNDGDLDLILCGETQNQLPQTKIYQNNGGTLQEVGMVLPGLTIGSAQWGDYDTDGDLDLLITGATEDAVAKTLVLRNDNGQFTDPGISLPDIMNGEAAWGDADNDGDLDIVVAGQTEGLNFSTLILRNEGDGVFVNTGVSFPGIQSASVCWVDYNNDGQPDVMISGDSGGGMISKLFRQDNGSFSEVNADGFLGLCNGDLAWGDLDNDGDMDLVLGGMDLGLDGHLMLYRNDGNDQFTLLYTMQNPIAYTAIDLGDYNNDGWLDVIVTGKIVGCGGTAATLVYRNESFLNFFEESTLIPGFKQGDVAWGDFNNDGYSDLLLTGLDGYDAPKTQLYQNNGGSGTFSVNTAPASPEGLSASTSGNSATIRWNRSSDIQTPSEGLSYNVYVGTLSAIPDVVSPGADPSSGFRYLASIGNTSQDTSITLCNLDDGTYFWSVQAIDNGFMGGGFSPEQTFTINAVGMEDPVREGEILAHPNPAESLLTIRIQDTRYATGESRIQILDVTGHVVLTRPFSGMSVQINVTGLVPGIYTVRIQNGTITQVQKVIKL